MTNRRQFITGTAALGAAAAAGFPRPALAQAFPSQDLHFVCGLPPGSGADVIVRFFAERIRPLAGKNVIVENRVGAGGNLAIEHIARARPDGHTMLLHGGNAIAGMMSLLKNPPVDVAKTIQLAATINRQAFMFIVDARKPWKTIDELTKAMLEKGEKASYATNTVDATVMGEIYKAKTGVKAVEVTYKTATDTVNDMLSGQIDYAVHNPIFALSQHREGKMRILGVGSTERLQAVPDLPTMTEQGIPMNVIGWWSVSVPAGTPRSAVETINKWFVQVVGTEEAKKFLNNGGGDPMITTPDEAQQMMLKDIENWKEYVRIAKITPTG